MFPELFCRDASLVPLVCLYVLYSPLVVNLSQDFILYQQIVDTN